MIQRDFFIQLSILIFIIFFFKYASFNVYLILFENSFYVCMLVNTNLQYSNFLIRFYTYI